MTNLPPLIVIASNRGPFSFLQKADGSFEHRKGAGGLVTALGALAQQHEVLWIAGALSKEDQRWAKIAENQPVQVDGVHLKLIIPNKDAYQQYYNKISNPLLWFIQHQLWDTPRAPTITRSTWEAWHNGYIPINHLFAQTIAETVRDTQRPVLVFPQDYHLYMLPQFLRQLMGERAYIQPFIHIPWPGPDAWRILPEEMRNGILVSLMQADRVGFQTHKDAFNFVQTCRFYISEAHSYGARDAITYMDRKVIAGNYPISVDVDAIKALADERETRLLKSNLINLIGDQKLILRVDRVEPSKNILRGLQAFRSLLERYPEYHGKVQKLALLVPSRMEVSEYQSYLQEIMATAGMINAGSVTASGNRFT